MTDVALRRATAGDVPAIHALLRGLARHDGTPLRVTEDALGLHGFGPRPLFHAVLAEQGGVPVGLALFYPDFSTIRGEPGAYVQDLFVAETARGLGLGRRLLAGALAVAQDWQARYLVLLVDRDNAGARAFYKRLGFADRGRYRSMILDAGALSGALSEAL